MHVQAEMLNFHFLMLARVHTVFTGQTEREREKERVTKREREKKRESCRIWFVFMLARVHTPLTPVSERER
jgi:hypothetical protein